jgi:uncharacterized iron-regulated membrane protein
VLRARTVKAWYRVHKWTSLVCTAFLLLLCLTGLPLIFHHELDHLLGNAVEAPAMPADTPRAMVDSAVAAAQARHPQEVVRFVYWEEDEPDLVYVTLAVSRDAPPDADRLVVVDARTAEVLGEPDIQSGLMYVLYKLHVDLFAGLPGKLFLGLMGLLFVASIVSGIVVYGPFMRRLDFGTLRLRQSRRLRWLDLHNLLGIVTVAWVLVVGGTGAINTLADVLIQLWRFDQLSTMIAPYAGKPPLDRLGSVDRALATAAEAAPGMTPSFVAFPGSFVSSEHHYMVAMRGETPLTSRLIRPVLVDAATGALTDTRDMPWYITALLVSQPLHFGDYGGMPLKVIWAVLDVITIAVLASGLYLWLARRRTPVEIRVDELEREELATARAAG